MVAGRNPIVDQLDVRVLLALPQAFLRRLPAASATAGVATALEPGSTTTRFLGSALPVTSVTLGLGRHAAVGGREAADLGRAVRLAGVGAAPPASGREPAVATGGVVAPSRIVVARPRRRCHLRRFAPRRCPHPHRSARARLPVTISVRLAGGGGGTFALSGRLARLIRPPHWVYEGSAGRFALFANTAGNGPRLARAGWRTTGRPCQGRRPRRRDLVDA